MKQTRLFCRKPEGHWLRVVEAGPEEAPTVLLVHGAAGSWHNFRPQVRELALTHRVVAPDLRGHGDSPWPGPSRVSDFLDDLLDLVETLPPRFDVVAHSFGGCLATQLAWRFPERVRSLSLLNTAGHIPQGLTYRVLQLFSPLADVVLRSGNPAISSNSLVSQELVYRVLKEWDVWDLFPALRVPCQIVLGHRDMLIPLALGRKAGALIPGCQVRELPHCGHVAMWEAPTQLLAWLREMLPEGRPTTSS